MEEKLRQIVADVFLIDIDQVTIDSSPDTIQQWDSIGHLNLITSIEEAFEITFTEDQISEILNFKLAIAVTEEAIAQKNKL